MSAMSNRVFDHILIIMFENQYRSYILQNAYMRGLAAQGIDLANAFGVMHPSQTNYISSIAGELCNVTSDDAISPLLTQRTIVDLLEASPYGLRWKAYMDTKMQGWKRWASGYHPIAGAGVGNRIETCQVSSCVVSNSPILARS